MKDHSISERAVKINNYGPPSAQLSELEAVRFVTLALEATQVTTTHDFEAWVKGSIRPFFPHDMLIAGSVRDDFTEIAIDRLISVDFPMTYIEAVKLNHGSFTCPTLDSWFSSGHRSRLFDPTVDKGEMVPWAPEFYKFELKNDAAHGVVSPDRRTATYFSFSGIPGPLSDRHRQLLELIVPHLHQAYVRAISSTVVHADCAKLSDFEATLLHWISKGKSDADIAAIHGRTPHAIKHGIRRLLAKLNVATRYEALAKAAWVHHI